MYNTLLYMFPPISPTGSFVLFCDLLYLLLVVCLSICARVVHVSTIMDILPGYRGTYIYIFFLGGGGYVLSGHCSRQQISVIYERVLILGFTFFFLNRKEKSQKDFSGWRPAIAFLYLVLFHSLLRLTSFLSQNEKEKRKGKTMRRT